MPYPLVLQVCFVAFVGDVADEISPRDAICAFDEPGVGYWTEGFSYVACVGDVAVGGEEDGAEAGGIGSVAD